MGAVADLAIGKPRGVLENLVLRQETSILPDLITKNYTNFREGDLFNVGPLSCNFGIDYLKAVQKVTKENTERLISLIKEQDDYIKENNISLPGYSGFLIFKAPEFDDRGRIINCTPEKVFIGPEESQSKTDIEETPVTEKVDDVKVSEIEIEGSNEQAVELPCAEINDTDSKTPEKDLIETSSTDFSSKLVRDLGWNSDEENDEVSENSDPSSYPIRYFPDRETTRLLEGDLSICNDDRSEKEKEYLQIYSAGLEETEDSELPCSSKSVSQSPVPAETSGMSDRFEKATIRFYSRKSVMASKQSKVEVEAKTTKTKSKSQVPEENDAVEGEPLFVISSVMGNADFAFENVPDDYSDPWTNENEETNEFFDNGQSTITPKKTNDITKIKGWRKKQFAMGQSSVFDFVGDEVSNSEDGAGDNSKDVSSEEPEPEPAPISIYPYTIVKQEPLEPEEEIPADSAFVCDSLDDFLDKEADLKINYEIPHLYAEVGIKLTSEEIVSRPKISRTEPLLTSPQSSENMIEDLLLSEGSRTKFLDRGIKRTDYRKMQARCLKNLIDYRFHCVSAGGKLIKVAGSYDSRPLKTHESKSAKLAVWANKTRSFDDIFQDLMQDDSVEEERTVDKSVVLLHNKKVINDPSRWNQTESPQKTFPKTDLNVRESPVQTSVSESISETEPEEVRSVPDKENSAYVQNKLVGLTVYPGPFAPLPPVVQYHLRKMRNYRTKIDREWANFATSALKIGDEPAKRKRMILPVICPVVCRPGEEVKRSDFRDVLRRFRRSEYFKSLKKDTGKKEVSKTVRGVVDNLLKTVARKVGKEEKSKKKKEAKRGKRLQISESHIISSDEKRTRKIPGKYKDTTLLIEKDLPNSWKSNDFSSTIVAFPELPKKFYAKRRLEKIKELKAKHNIKECKVVMHKMKGLARVAPWCMKHECYSCQPCRLKNPHSSKYFKLPNTKKRRPTGIKEGKATRNIAVKRTAPRNLFPVSGHDVGGDLSRNVPMPLRNIWTEVTDDTDKIQQQQQKRFTLESVFEESERSRLDSNQSVRQITFNRVVTKLLSEKLRDLKSTKHFTSCINNLRHLRPNVIELIKLSLVQESFSSGYIYIWYLKGKTSTKSRAFLTFSKLPPVDGAINLKHSSEFFTEDLPKVIIEIISEKSRFDPDDYAILHCDGSLWEIHGSVNFAVERNEELERPIEETKIIYADEVIVSELRFMSRLHPGKVFDNPAKWWIIDMSQEYLEILTRVDGKIFKFQRADIMKYMELKVFRFVNIGRNGSPIFGTYLIPAIFPYGLIGPYHLHENHGLELKIHGKSVPFTYHEPGPDSPRLYPDVVPPYEEPADPPDVAFGLKHLIRSTVSDFKKAHKEIVGLWLHDKTMKKEPSFLEVQTRLKRMTPTASNRRSGYDLSMEHDYSLSPRDERSDVEFENPSEALRASRTSGVEQSRNFFGKRRSDFDEGPDYNVYLVPDIPNLGYIKGQLMSDQSVTISHPLTPNKLINSLKMDEWLNNFLKQKIQFIPKDLKIKWQTVTSPEEIRNYKPLNKFCLGGTHILCQKGLFYMLSMNKTMLEKLGLDKSDVLKAISDSTIIKEVMEVKELGKLVTMEDECNLSISEVLELAIREVKSLEARCEELVKMKAATEKRKWKLCRQYMEALRSCNIQSSVKKKLFSNLKKQLLAIQEERKKADMSSTTSKKHSYEKLRPSNSREVSDVGEINVVEPDVKIADKTPKTKSVIRKKKTSAAGKSKPESSNVAVQCTIVTPPKINREVPKSPRGRVSILDQSRIQGPEIDLTSTVPEIDFADRIPEIELTSTIPDIDLTGRVPDIIEVEVCDTPVMSPLETQVLVEIDTEVPRAAAEETVSSANDEESMDEEDIKKLESKLAHIYQLLRTKTQPEDAEEYQHLLSRLSIISRQLEFMKSKVAENAPPKPLVVTHGNVTVTVTDDRRALQPVEAPVKFQPSWQIQRLPNAMQPKSTDLTQPLFVITVNSDPESVKTPSRKSFFAESAESRKQVSPLENTVVNGNKRFKIERKLEKSHCQEGKNESVPGKESRYVVNKPYFPPETTKASADLKTNTVESETTLCEERIGYDSEERICYDSEEVWIEADEEVENNSRTIHSFTSPHKHASNFLISISKDSGKKICRVKKPEEESRDGEGENKKSGEKEKKRLEFVPLLNTSLNTGGNVTIRRDIPTKIKPQVEIFPAKSSSSKSKSNILKSVLVNRPLKKNTNIYFLPERSSSADELSDNLIDSDSVEMERSDGESSGVGYRSVDSEYDGKRKPTVLISYPPAKKSKILLNSVTSDTTSKSSSDEKNFSGDSESSATAFDVEPAGILDTTKEKEKGTDIVLIENDDETSWLTMNAEDIEKKFQKLIEPITGDLLDEKEKNLIEKQSNDERIQEPSVSTQISNER